MVPRTAIDVGEPDNSGPQPVVPGRPDESFALDLCASVDVDGPQWRIFGNRKAIGLPIDLATTGEDDPGPTRLTLGRRDNVAQPADIDLPTGFRIALSPYDAGNRSEMDNTVAPDHGLPDTPRVPHITCLTASSSDIQPCDIRPEPFKGRSKGPPDQSFRAGKQYPATHLGRSGQATPAFGQYGRTRTSSFSCGINAFTRAGNFSRHATRFFHSHTTPENIAYSIQPTQDNSYFENKRRPCHVPGADRVNKTSGRDSDETQEMG